MEMEIISGTEMRIKWKLTRVNFWMVQRVQQQVNPEVPLTSV
jgi:hypothetical protein